MSKYRYGPYLVTQLLLKKRKEKQVINVYSYKINGDWWTVVQNTTWYDSCIVLWVY